MGNYTDFLEDFSYDILEEGNYQEELKKVAELFRTFDKALDSFLEVHGYSDDLSDTDKKIEFISNKFKDSCMKIPRNIKKWFIEHKRIERRTAFQLCFAFRLSLEETRDFLRRICLERGFDCHNVEEIVYFYAFKKRLNYQDTLDILGRVTIVKPGKLDVETDSMIYTKLITDEIEKIDSTEELIRYLNENQDKFGYNNATAYESIRSIWTEISKNNGIAIREKKQLYFSFDKDEISENIAFEKERKIRKRMDDSIWEIYLQILGLSGDYVNEIYNKRSLKSIIKDNDLLHPLAEDSFPDRDGLNKILNGEHVSYERVRKLLILLVFYKYWAVKALNKNSYHVENNDLESFISTLNNYLIEAGYPILYPGNPYDFIIFMCVNANEKMPLLVFREYMHQLFYNVINNS